jgi:hypothetical protein
VAIVTSRLGVLVGRRRDGDPPWTFRGGKDLLAEAPDAARLDADLCLVAVLRGQYVLTPAADSFYKRVTWDGDLAAAWRG